MADRWTSFEVVIKHPSTQDQDDVYALLEKLLDAGQLQIKDTKDWSISQSVLIETVGEDDDDEEDDFEFEEITAENGRFLLTLEYIREGLTGDYDKNDEKDVRLLRYTLNEKIDGEWEQVNDGSACTLLHAEERREYLEIAAIGMLDYITLHSKDGEVNDEALQNLSHAELVGIKAKLRLPKIK
jgi:hypothetical protein